MGLSGSTLLGLTEEFEGIREPLLSTNSHGDFGEGMQLIMSRKITSIFLRIVSCYCALLVLMGIHHCWTCIYIYIHMFLCFSPGGGGTRQPSVPGAHPDARLRGASKNNEEQRNIQASALGSGPSWSKEFPPFVGFLFGPFCLVDSPLKVVNPRKGLNHPAAPQRNSFLFHQGRGAMGCVESLKEVRPAGMLLESGSVFLFLRAPCYFQWHIFQPYSRG